MDLTEEGVDFHPPFFLPLTNRVLKVMNSKNRNIVDMAADRYCINMESIQYITNLFPVSYLTTKFN